MFIPKSIYTRTAFEVIKRYLNGEDDSNIEIADELRGRKACFVTIHNNDHSLRGCIGTILPYRENLLEEIKHNAVASATQDPRFDPMTAEELQNVYITVDILSEPVLVETLEELNPKKYGVIVTSGYKRGVLLPDLEGVESVSEQLRIVKIKAGIRENEEVEIKKFTVERYF